MMTDFPLVLLATDNGLSALDAVSHLEAYPAGEGFTAVRSSTVLPVDPKAEAKHLLVVAFGPNADGIFNMLAAAGVHAVVSTQATKWAAIREAAQTLSDDETSNGVVLLSEEARLGSGWLTELIRVADRFEGRVIVGAVSEQSKTVRQRLHVEEVMGLQEFSELRIKQFGGAYAHIDTLDDLVIFFGWHPDVSFLAESLYADFGDQNLTFLPHIGINTVAALGCYSSRVITATPRPHLPGKVEERLALYSTQELGLGIQTPVVGCMVIGFNRLRDFHLLRGSLARLIAVTDRVSILLLNNPLEVESDPELKDPAVRRALPSAERNMLGACSDASVSEVQKAFKAWVLLVCPDALEHEVEVRVHTTGMPTDSETMHWNELHRSIAPGEWSLHVRQSELVEAGVTRRFIQRLTQHPNPAIRAYDFGERTLWDAPHLVREDAPWGDGGSNRGVWSLRMFKRRPNTYIVDITTTSSDGIRAAAVRLDDAAMLRPCDRDALAMRAVVPEEAMRMSTLPAKSRMGLHMLTYEKESAEDVARWLDEVYGLIDHGVVIWTGVTRDEHGIMSPAFRTVERVVAWFPQVELLVHELGNNIAEARNVGIRWLSSYADLAYAMFVDPDEWLADPVVDGRALRRMCEGTRAGWLFNVANRLPEGGVTVSESIRVSRLVPEMVMTGRVHESFGRGIAAIQAKGEHPRIAYAPFVLQHRGMALGTGRTAEKLAHYEALLRLELEEHPDNAGAWVSLGWHYLNGGNPAAGEECLQRSIACAGMSYLPFRELAVLRLREAKALFELCCDRLAPAHSYTPHAKQILAWLEQYAPEPVQMSTLNPSSDPLPTPPAGYDGVTEEP